MKRSRHLLESVDRSWSRSNKMIVVDLVNTTLQYRRRLAQRFSDRRIAGSHRSARGQDDRVGLACECRLAAVLGPRTRKISCHRNRAGATHQVRDKRIVTRGVKRLGRQLIKNSYRRFLTHRLLDRIRPLPQRLDQDPCLLLLAENLADLFDRSEHAFEVVWICDEHCDVLVLKLLCEYLELRRGCDQNNLRLERDYAFETRMKRVADFGDSFCFGRIIAVSCSPHQAIASTNCKNNFRQVRSE